MWQQWFSMLSQNEEEQYDSDLPRRLPDDKGCTSTSESEESPDCTMSRSLKDDIRACLGGFR